jgi:hypothetical protein
MFRCWCDGASIFVDPVEPGPGKKLHAAIVDARRHAEAIEFDLIEAQRLLKAAEANCGRGRLGVT